MADLLTKTFYLGLGLYSMTKDRAEEGIDELIESGRMRREEGSQAVGGLLERAEREKAAFDRKVHDAMEEAIKNLHLARQSDIEEISRKLDRLLEAQGESAASSGKTGSKAGSKAGSRAESEPGNKAGAKSGAETGSESGSETGSESGSKS